MQTLRKKTSPLKSKNETTRFLGDGVSFKAKLIGILEVSEARGDRMCQEALSDLKMAIRAAGEHKQRITVNIAIDGLRLRDEKTGDSLYHHPVHKISFIAQDMTDSRAFGYIFGSPDTGHRFFGIKTDKAASQVVIAMRDLFQVVFALKKKEIELAKQHLDRNRFTSSPLFSDSSVSSTKLVAQEHTKNIVTSESKTCSNAEAKMAGTAVADLVDLELELNSLQQGLNQMERITPSDPFGSKDDPFGDSFTNYSKPILPPPPSSGRDRFSRSSETSSLFSPRTPRTVGSLDSSCDTSLYNSKNRKIKKDDFAQEIHSSHQEPNDEDWFSQPSAKGIFEEPPSVPEPTKDEKHEMTKQEILSQFDIFTELDPLGTGKNKPYVDKKHFFQELKNPPRKVLNDLASQAPQQQTHLFNKNISLKKTVHGSDFTTDPFEEDPFVTEDPFEGTDFTKNDPFNPEFTGLKIMVSTNGFEHFKFDANNQAESLQLSQKISSRSPKEYVDNQMSVISTSLKSVYFDKLNTVDVRFDKFESRPENKLILFHGNATLDVSSESESVPDPPQRPESSLTQAKPPPLPPKKQSNDFSIKHPKPPCLKEPHYDYMEVYEATTTNGLEAIKNLNKTPPVPVPARKTKFELDFVSPLERPKKQFSVQSSDEDYLTPISFDLKTEFKDTLKETSPILLPPPQKSCKKHNVTQVTNASFLDSEPNLTTSTATDKLSPSMKGLDITLSQLTLSGLNELGNRLNIPTNQLSNMTLSQLTNYLSNFVKCKKGNEIPLNLQTNSNSTTSHFDADFGANFNSFTCNTTPSNVKRYDRYAVFRELMKEEIKQTKIETEPEELKEKMSNLSNAIDNNTNHIYVTIDNDAVNDKYAALREIVESELKLNETEHKDDDNNENEQKIVNKQVKKGSDEISVINIENKFIAGDKEQDVSKHNSIEYIASVDSKDLNVTNGSLNTLKSPVNKALRSPVPTAITEIIQSNVRLNSGSLSDIVSGSSPEIDNIGSNSEIGKDTGDAAGESWAIFDQGIPTEPVKQRQTIQSEEGLSPWSSDSKEFANGSPVEWQHEDSESGGDHWTHGRIRKDREGWWDTSAEPEMKYYSSNRRSTDSCDDNFEYYERPRRRKLAGYVGGHSSSSRDVSPWEDEPKRETRKSWMKHARQHSVEKYRERRHTDSWDDEDDFEYEEEHVPRFQRSELQKWEMERYDGNSREHSLDKWEDQRSDDRRLRRRREGDKERWCCPDWEIGDHDKHNSRHNAGRRSHKDELSGMWRNRICDERYYSRESQESPWEDDYSNEAGEVSSSLYLATKRKWKRPSSASEMDRKTGEIRSRRYFTAVGSDDERDRRFKPGRPSRSRVSKYLETSYRHKSKMVPTTRAPPKSKMYSSKFQNEFRDLASKKQTEASKLDSSNTKTTTLTSRKKTKDSTNSAMNIVGTFPRMCSSRIKSLFENDFVHTDDSSSIVREESRLNFKNKFETYVAQSPTLVTESSKDLEHSLFEIFKQANTDFDKGNYRQRPLKELKLFPKWQSESKSLFDDDFYSPSGKPELLSKYNSISSIKEGVDFKAKEEVGTNYFENATNLKKNKINKHKHLNSAQSDINMKKSESVNIFARENDPFDDDFFSENVTSYEEKQESTENSSKQIDLKWTDDFDEFSAVEKK